MTREFQSRLLHEAGKFTSFGVKYIQYEFNADVHFFGKNLDNEDLYWRTSISCPDLRSLQSSSHN